MLTMRLRLRARRDKKGELEKAFIVSADKAAKQWSGKYAAQKALAYKAKIDEAKKDWAGAEREWLAILSSSANSYLAPVALQGAASAAEEQGAFDRSLARLQEGSSISTRRRP